LILWTIHPEAVFEKTLRLGYINGDGRRVFAWHRDKYRWMASKMVERGIVKKPLYPVWAWHTYYGRRRQPDLRCSGLRASGTAAVCVEFEIDDGAVLLSLYDMWEWVLNGFYIPDNPEDPDDDEPTEEPGVPNEKVRRSWEKIFDLNGCRQHHDRPSERPIQACVPIVYHHQIRRVVHFVAR